MKVMRDLVGETLSDRYAVVSRIAGGGMGDVYRAQDLLLDRPVAVKVLQPGLASDPDLVARFKAEARAAARLNHPNVVAVHDWGSADERTYYMVMEYVSGTDLRDLLVGKGPMDPAHACEVMAAVCDALDAAHSNGLVHRDVKPENVLIARDGSVKVADFGIAALADAGRTLTGGGVLGTLRYLSPEQAAGAKATTASDVWAAGAVLFELLTSTTPQGGSGAELLRRRATEEPVPPSELEPGVPAEIDAVVLRACAIDPEQRYSSAGEMASDLRRILSSLPARPRPVRELFHDFTDEVRLPDMTPTGFVDRRGARHARRHQARVRALRLSGTVVLLAALLFGGWRAGAAVFGPKEVEVPKLYGLTQEAAEARADELGFEIDVIDSKRHEDLAAGYVIEQTPATGELLLQGETIKVVVSKGYPMVKVPKLTGVPLDEAKRRLEALNLVPGEVTKEFSVEVARGRVIETLPPKRRIEERSEVPLLVSKGPRDIELPDVAGLKAAKARSIIEGEGFVVEEVAVYSDTVPAGRVVATEPGGGSIAPEGSTVVVSVSQGPEYEEIEMPDVRNMSVHEARSELEALGLKVKISRSCPGATVIETDPQPGVMIRENSTVTLLVC